MIKKLIISSFLMLLIPVGAVADVGPGWLSSQDDLEDKVSSITEKVFKGFLLLGAGLGAVGLAWSFCEMSGFIGDRENGIKKLKMSLIILVLCGLAYSIIGWIMSSF